MNNKIKVERAVNNLTQEQLAEKVSVTRQTINAIELKKFVPSTVVSVISTSDHKVTTTITVGSKPNGIVLKQ